jgi:threonine dehydrogenase-like Zn-dependent dehydrogenase
MRSRRLFALNGEPVIRTVSLNGPRAGEILVATAFSTVSRGTELGILRKSLDPNAADEEYPQSSLWSRPIRGLSLPDNTPRLLKPGMRSLGYSLSGTVLHVGEKVTHIRLGDRVACSGSQCAHHSQIVCVPESLAVRVSDGVSLEDASFVTLGAISIEAVRATRCTFGETIVVYGLGLVGLLVAQIARAAGLRVIAVDTDDNRIAIARAQGTIDAVNPNQVDLVECVTERTEGFGADAVVLALSTSSGDPLNAAFDLCRQRGIVVGLGLFPADVDRRRMRDITFVRTIAYGPGRYDPWYEEGNVDYPIGFVRWTENRNMRHFLWLLEEHRVTLEGLVGSQYPLEEAAKAYRALSSSGAPPTIQFSYGANSPRDT